MWTTLVSSVVRADLTEDQIREQVQEMIVVRHPTDQEGDWLKLGSGAPSILISMYDAETISYRKLRILQGLGYFKEDPRAVEFLKKQVETSSDRVTRYHALRVIAEQYGEKEESFLGAFLDNEDPQIRRIAAQAFVKMNSPTARDRLAQFKKTEKVPWLKAEVEGQVPPSPSPPTLVTSTSPEGFLMIYSGEWVGKWVSLKTPESVLSVSLRLQVKSPQVLEGTLKQETPSPKQFQLSQVKGKSKDWRGAWVNGKQSFPFEAAWRNDSGDWLLEMRLPQQGAWILLRKKEAASQSSR